MDTRVISSCHISLWDNTEFHLIEYVRQSYTVVVGKFYKLPNPGLCGIGCGKHSMF